MNKKSEINEITFLKFLEILLFLKFLEILLFLKLYSLIFSHNFSVFLDMKQLQLWSQLVKV
jgi:hypothetical protein